MAKGDDLEQRLIDFAVRIINLCTHLPKTPAGKHVSGQLLRSGTSPAPNYGEARSAESTDDFVHKLKVVHKELNESRVWLLIIKQSEMLPSAQLKDIIPECEELCRIIGSSIKTSRKREQA
jgi:four helix bundle protein